MFYVCVTSVSLRYPSLRGYTPTQSAEYKGHRHGKSVTLMWLLPKCRWNEVNINIPVILQKGCVNCIWNLHSLCMIQWQVGDVWISTGISFNPLIHCKNRWVKSMDYRILVWKWSSHFYSRKKSCRLLIEISMLWKWTKLYGNKQSVCILKKQAFELIPISIQFGL